MRVIRAEEGHIPQIIERWKELMDYHKELDPYFTRDPKGHLAFEGHIRECLGSDNDLILVAIEGEDVVGYLLAHLSSKPPVFELRTYGEISDLAVRKDQWRRGVGERMYRGALKWFKSKGMQRIEVRAIPSNKAAMEFWKKHGFKDYFNTMYLEP